VDPRRYRLDDDVERHDRVLIGGSPLKLFRLTGAGNDVVDQVSSGRFVPESRLVDSLLDAGAIHPVSAPASRHGVDDVTIVVPTLGPAAHAPPGSIVVDDGSDEPVRGAALRLHANSGPAAARNAGLRLVTTPLVAFVDSDVQLPENWLDPLLGHFDDDTVALVAPRVASAPGTTTLGAYEADHSPLDLGDRAGRVRAGTRVSYVPAAAIVVRVDVLRSIGGFDEALRFGEDVDLVWRLDAAGWRVRYEPAVTVVHEPRASWRGWFRQRVGYGSSAAPLAARHPGALAPLRLSGWSVASWVLGVMVHPLLGASIGVGSAAALVRKLRDVPARAAFRLAWRGNLYAGEQIANAIRRVWWPVLLLVGLRSRRTRVALALAVAAGRRPIRVADDVAYSLGLWRGVIAERQAGPLVPDVSSWPGRRSTSPHAADH
jgi:mycofactocin system glycosyltransferase